VKPWLITCAFSAAALCAQDQAPTLNDAEKKFQATMENVTLVGYYTFGDSADLKADQYRVEHITKVKEDTWNFEARFKMGQRDMKVTLPIPVKFAGDTPVISLTNYSVMGMGSFSARIVFYDGAYAGTWAASADHRGVMFGKIVKGATTGANDASGPLRGTPTPSQH
jgi:hypothetical protein